MPTSAILSLNDFKSSPFGRFAPGTWVVEYHDRTHLPEDVYVSLGKVEIEECTQSGDAFFWFRPRSRESLEGSQTPEQDPETNQERELSIREAWNKGRVGGSKSDKEKRAPRAAEVILDQLSESMVRLGLVRPVFETDRPGFITERGFAVVVLDTNALRDGAIRHLREEFQNVQLWTIIPIVPLMEIGERITYMTRKDREGCKVQNSALIRKRPQVTIAPQEVKWIKENFPTETLELAPELLRTFRGYETRREDPYREPDRISINDRLILEGIKDLRRQRGLPEGVYLMSGDKDMSRLAQLEGIHTIYPARPAIQEFSEGIYSLRYSLEARAYFFCSIHRFLWDLTHVFSKIRARCLSGSQAGRTLELLYYYPTKLVNDWVDDKLEVTDLGSGPAADTV
jgi:hypothetical protein